MKRYKWIIIKIILISGFLLPAVSFSQYAIDGAFGNGSMIISDSANFTIHGIIGQPVTGISGNDTYYASAGFWFQRSFIFTSIYNPFLADIPATFILYQNYPNPFNPETTIKYGLPKASTIKIELYTLLGQKIACLYDGKKEAGFHLLNFNAEQLASGLYLYTLQADNIYKVKKMILVK